MAEPCLRHAVRGGHAHQPVVSLPALGLVPRVEPRLGARGRPSTQLRTRSHV